MSDHENISQRIKLFRQTHNYETLSLSTTSFDYLLCGSGAQTLVFLDGGLGTSESWFEYIEFFEKDYQILTFSFPVNLNTNSKLVFAIKELLTALKIQNPIFIGASYGALLAQLFVSNFPESVHGLVLISGGGMTEVTKSKLRRLKIHFQLSIWLVKILPFKFVKRTIIQKSINNLTTKKCKEKNIVISEIMNSLYANLSKGSLLNMGNLLINIFDCESLTEKHFKALDSKVLLILPEHDFFPKESQESLIKLMSHPKIILIENGSHGDPLFELAYIQKISSFLKSNIA